MKKLSFVTTLLTALLFTLSGYAQPNVPGRYYESRNFLTRGGIKTEATGNHALDTFVQLQCGDTGTKRVIQLPRTRFDNTRPREAGLFYDMEYKHLWYSDGTDWYRISTDSTKTD